MQPTKSNPLGHYFDEGMKARRDGKTLHDNPYGAGSPERREWAAGFCATVEAENEDGPKLDPNDGPQRRESD